jgi:urease accessory protein
MTMPTEAAQLRLLSWFSPAFPVGAFAYSHGLETAIQEGAVTDARGLVAWIAGLLENGSGWTDAVLFTAAWSARDGAELAEVGELADALSPSLERRRETLSQGEAFLQAVRPWTQPLVTRGIAYPVAAGGSCAAVGIGLGPAIQAWLHGFAANLVSVALRAMPLGQTDGVMALARLEPVILAVAERAQLSTLDDLGACAIASDIAAMRHETLQPRIFIS